MFRVPVALTLFAFTGALVAATPTQQDDAEKKLADMGITLPATKTPPIAIYKPAVVVGNMLYLSGHISRSESGEILKGKLGDGVTLEQGQAAARRSAIALLATIKNEVGLRRVKRLVKTTGMVNCTPNFTDQSKVINGCSQLFKDVFGEENGVGARAAVGMSSLPAGSICEIEMILEIEP